MALSICCSNGGYYTLVDGEFNVVCVTAISWAHQLIRLWVSSGREGELPNNEDKVRELCHSCYYAPRLCPIMSFLCYCIHHVVPVMLRFKRVSESLKYSLQDCSCSPLLGGLDSLLCEAQLYCLEACPKAWGKRGKMLPEKHEAEKSGPRCAWASQFWPCLYKMNAFFPKFLLYWIPSIMTLY